MNQARVSGQQRVIKITFGNNSATAAAHFMGLALHYSRLPSVALRSTLGFMLSLAPQAES